MISESESQPPHGPVTAALVNVRTAEGLGAFLARASLALASTLDVATRADCVARLAAGELAAACLVDLVTPSGLRRLAVAHMDETLAPPLQQLRGPRELSTSSPQARALRSGQLQIGDVGTGGAASRSLAADEEPIFRSLGLSGCIAIPMYARSQTLGVITLLSCGPARDTADALDAISEFGRTASLFIDNALLYEKAVRAHAAADAARNAAERLVADLSETEERYRTLFEESRDAIYITTANGRFVDANPAALAMLGFDRAELSDRYAGDLYAHPAQGNELRTRIERDGFVRDYEIALRRPDGETIDCLVSAIARRDENGTIIEHQGMLHDITERKRAELRLMESEHFTRAIISSVRQGIIVFDRELRYQLWNRYMEEITGIRSAEVLGTSALDTLPFLHGGELSALLRRALTGESVHASDTRFHIARTGRMGWISTVFAPHVSAAGDIIGVVAIVHDITERKHAEQQLAHSAFHDALTHLPNRSLFMDRLERLLSHSKRHRNHVFGVALLDLDRFKVITDSLGHVIGDQLLVSIAHRLQHCIRHGDTVARLGGDEFAILVDDIGDVSDVTRVAERVLTEMHRPFDVAGHEVFTTASIGIALSSTGYDRPEDILRDADTAMYRAKLDGRSRYELFDRQMHQQAVRTLQTETDLRHALDRAEFRVHYQPIIGLAHGRIIGFEALVRWQHPTRGLVMPGEFVPLAEETGLIVPIGWWVLREACGQMQAWLKQFPARQHLSVSVNLSTRQFMQPDLVEQVERALSLAGLPPHALKLEITESAVMQREELVTAMLMALRARGIKLCIDDFGTGYSSLRYLHAFPVDSLKIDRSFVSQIGVEGTPRLLETIVALGRNMGMETVAEGVETDEQLRFLRALGPQSAQGFLFSRACSAVDIEQMLATDPVW